MKASQVYDFPLRPDFLVQLVLPSDLTIEEARRIGAFLETLAVDVSPERIDRIISSAGRSDANHDQPTPTPTSEHR